MSVISLAQILSHADNSICGIDENEPLPSETQLGLQSNEILLRDITPSAFKLLTDGLNPEQLITTDDGLARDYRGVSQQMGFSYIELENFKRNTSPAEAMFKVFISKRPQSTMNDLLKFLEAIERYDIIDDLAPHLQVLVSNRTTRENGGNNLLQMPSETIVTDPKRSMTDLLTTDDVIEDQLDLFRGVHSSTDTDLPLSQSQYYDAFVCYADEDADFVYNLIHILEYYKISILTKERFLAGHVEFDAITQAIDQRCKRTIIVLSPQFLESSKCLFQSKFAYALAYEQNKLDMRKIIPVLYKSCVLPHTITMTTKVDLTYNSTSLHQLNRKLQWSLEKLIKSIMDTNVSTTASIARDIHVRADMAMDLYRDRVEILENNVSHLGLTNSSPAVYEPLDLSQQQIPSNDPDKRLHDESIKATTSDISQIDEANQQRDSKTNNKGYSRLQSADSVHPSSTYRTWMKRIKRKMTS